MTTDPYSCDIMPAVNTNVSTSAMKFASTSGDTAVGYLSFQILQFDRFEAARDR